MRYTFFILAAIVFSLGSCTTMYKSGQTPDDVYYSPGRPQEDYVNVESDRNNRYQNDDYYSSDRYLRMKSQSRNRWSSFDEDFYYWNNPTWNNPYYFNSRYTPWANPWVGSYGIYGYNYWNSGYYNPFLPGYYSSPVVIVSKPVNPKVYTPRGGSLNTYNYSPASSVDPHSGRTYNISSNSKSTKTSGGSYYTTPSNRSYQYSNSGSSPSREFSTGSSNSSSNSSSSSRSSSGSSGSSSSGSAPVRSFPRGGGN